MRTRRAIDQIGEERRYQLLVGAVTECAIYLINPDGYVLSWNPGAERIKGYRSEEVVGRHFSNFFTEEDRLVGKPAHAIAMALQFGRHEDEGWRVRKDGSRFWSLTVIEPVRDENGRLVGFAKVARDMTERLAAQHRLEETREQLFQAQKMEAIGQLTGGVAHDFNNLLTVIVGSADLAESLVGDNDKLRRLIGNMRRAALCGEALTKQLLAFSRRQPLRPRVIHLSVQLQGITELLSRSLRGDISLHVDIDPDLLPVEADPSQLELAILNIGVNARDAMPDGGTLRISVANVDLAGEPGGLHGPHVSIRLADTGRGMSEHVRERAFEPFFTTKGVGRGSGLGLSQAYGFARQSGGTIVLDSEPGCGTTVTMYLPAAECRPEDTVAGSPAPAAQRARHATVLLAEDDPAVAELGLGILQGAGYTVRAVANAAEALAVLRTGAEIDLLFSDIMMPGTMNGVELAHAVRKEFPGVFILLTSGYADAASSRAAQEFPLITKPYGPQNLLAKVAEILGEAA